MKFDQPAHCQEEAHGFDYAGLLSAAGAGGLHASLQLFFAFLQDIGEVPANEGAQLQHLQEEV